MTLSDAEVQKQLQQAEELLFSGPTRAGFAHELYFGRFKSSAIIPAPELSPEEHEQGDPIVDAVKQFAEREIDPDAIDRQADIPKSVIEGLGKLGVLGATVSPEHGGMGLSQQNYCRIMEIIGGRCGSTAVFVNAHHSIGLRGLELFGTPEQKERWMKPLASGSKIAAFALTEPEAGSDASNVQTRAVPTDDGRGYKLTGEKRYITNGAIADVLTVMARTPDPHDPDGKITAFLVTPDMPGFKVVEARMEKVGIRGTATGRLAFEEMFVPKENILGPIGKGLKVALTVLDFGRTTFGASCTGASKFCLEKAVEHANRRKQFGRTLGEFELVREKIANIAAETFAMESATYYTASLIDSGAHDYMLETAMLKVFASDSLWKSVNDTLQIYGGAGFFTDLPFERMMRDSRLNLIGEGANDVLRCFIAMVGLRHVGKELEATLKKPWTVNRLWRSAPSIPVLHSLIADATRTLSWQIGKFGKVCRNVLIKHRQKIIDQQLIQARIGDIATELFMSSCVYARLGKMALKSNTSAQRMQSIHTGMFYIHQAALRNEQRFNALNENYDDLLNQTATAWLGVRDEG
ncbi:MAG: acyl-CoA dehydrogenase family protein [Planctomycetaceae bacterium]